jgi:hypothetical protein
MDQAVSEVLEFSELAEILECLVVAFLIEKKM